MNLIISLRSEVYKSKRTSSLYLALIAAAIVPAIIILDVIFDGVRPENKKDVFNTFFLEGFRNTGFVFFPMFLVLISTLLPQLEVRNNAWKQVLASPQSKLNVFLAKYLNIHLLILIFLIAHNVFMLVASIVIHFVEPELNLLNHPLDIKAVLVFNAETYLSLLAMGALQFWLGLRFRNFIVPIAIGFGLWFFGTLMVLDLGWKFAEYFPYSFHLYSVFDKHSALLPGVILASLIYTVVFLCLGFLDFNRRGNKA